MKHCKYMLCLWLFAVSFYPVRGQTRIIEHLKKNVYASLGDENKIRAILLLCDQGYSLHPDTLMYYAQKAFDIAVSTKNRNAQGWAIFHKSSALTNKGLLDSALHVAEECERMLQTELNNPLLLANI